MSLSSISGHTQYACRPAATSARMRAMTSSRRRAATSLVTTGESPGRHLVDDRHIEIRQVTHRQRARYRRAPSISMCGAPAPRRRRGREARAVAARRTDAVRRRSPGRAAEADRLLDQRVRADDQARSRPARRRLRAALVLRAETPDQPVHCARRAVRATARCAGSAARPGSRSAPSAPPASPLRRPCGRQSGDHCLAAADIALHEAMHRNGAQDPLRPRAIRAVAPLSA